MDTTNDGILPAELLYEILLCLPAKPLCRLRAVCRSWRSLLSDPFFVSSHGARHQQPLFAVGVYDYAGRDRLDAQPANVHILDASGQVVKRVYAGVCAHMGMCAQPDLFGFVGVKYNGLRVLDPATGRVTVLPDDHEHQMLRHDAFFALGRAASTGESRVLRVVSPFQPRGPQRQACRILTLGAGSGWREAQTSPDLIAPFKRYAAVKGVLYFLAFYKDIVLAFDLEKEQWRPNGLRTPMSRARPKWKYVTLAELNGRLAVVCDYDNTSVELWFLMSSDEVLWSKQYTIIMPFHPIYGSDRCVEALSVLDDGRIVFWVWHRPRGILRIYDPRSNMCKDVVEMANLIDLGVSVYKGSLLGAPV